MSKNGIVLSVLLVLLASAYVTWFTDLFRPQTIQIIPVIRPVRSTAKPVDPNQPQVYPVSFAFNRKCDLTSVKVVAADDLATNKHPVALWHLVSESNSVPTRSFIYGHKIKGMEPAVARMRPEPLQPNVEYVLQVEAGKLHAQVKFHTAEAVDPRQ
jgi:hypothetical protein